MPDSVYAAFEFARYYCEECDSHMFIHDFDDVRKNQFLVCPDHYSEDDNV